MKKVFTLVIAGALAATAINAQAQVALDGQITASEIGAATAGKYVLVGAYTQAHGYGSYGVNKLYAANTATKIYLFLQGTVESNGNAFQIYLDLPGVTGVAKGTALPGGTAASGTSFEKMKAKMDLDTDIAIGLQGNTAGQKINAISYIGTVSDKPVSPAVPLNGTPVTLDATTSAPIAQLANARMAYMNSADGKFGDANTVGWEIELDRAALGVPNSGATATATINVFAIMSNGSGEYLSSDMILEIPGNNGANLNQSVNVDFGALMGTQAAAVKLSSVLATKNAEAAALSLSVYPNPVTGSSRITYRVLDRAENVNIILTDLTGRTVRVVESGTKAVGAQTAVISTADVAAGTYLVRVQVGARVATSKVVLL